ncbi:transposase (plasmid) [Sinorhizobium americanum]|uniref:Transposase n=1 Tax=Sinorhizobium americanum TaxID=194963 RepID=A0A1L3LTI5_9HYPH|nr:transposase [Sinorhizobium americanum]
MVCSPPVVHQVRRRFARRLRGNQHSRNDVGQLDKVVITITGRNRRLWRAVDQDGYVLDEIVQTCRNIKAAKRLLTRLLKKQGIAAKRMITDKLRSYGAARSQVMPDVEHWSHKGLNNRAENAHVTLRKREADDARLPITNCNASFRASRPCAICSFRSAPLSLITACRPPEDHVA